MKTIIYYLVLSGTCSLMPLNAGVVQETTVAAGQSETPSLSHSEVTFTDVITLKAHEVSKFDGIEQVQQKYIGKKYPEYRVMISLFFKDGNNRFIEAMTLMNNDGEKAQIRFDMSEVYKSLKTKDKATKEKVEELESFYMDFSQKKQS